MGLEVTLEKGLIKVSVSRKFQENLGPVENPKDKEKPVPKIFNDEENASLEEWMEFVRTWGLNSRICEAAFQKIPLTKFSMNLLKKTYPYASLISSLIKEFITLKASFEQKATVGPWVILKVCFEDNLNTEDQKKLEKLFLDAINSYPINL
jgi:flavodoxin